MEKRNGLKWGVEGVKPGWGIYRGVGDEIWDFLQFFSNFWSSNGQITANSTANSLDESQRATSAWSPPLPTRQRADPLLTDFPRQRGR